MNIKNKEIKINKYVKNILKNKYSSSTSLNTNIDKIKKAIPFDNQVKK